MSKAIKSRRGILALLLLITVLAVTISLKSYQQANSAQTQGAGPQAGQAPLMPNGAGVASSGGAASQAYQAGQSPVTILPNGGEIRTDVKHDVSPPLRLIPAQPPGTVKRSREVENSLVPVVGKKLDQDPALQTFYGHLVIPTPIANFDGQYNYSGVIPPDTNGDVGPTYYVQTVNTTVQVFNKTTGASVFGPVDIKTLFTGFGGTCEARNDGDPIVLYDQFADRWQISQFTAPPGPYYQCIALSTSGDPTGSYYRYAFQTSAVNFEDYPHLGVWPDAYYMSTNEFANSTANVGAGFFAFERSKMLIGQPARQIMFTRPVPEGGYLPSDADGYNPPAAGTPNFFMAPNRQLGNAVRQYKFQIVTWDPAPVANLLGPVDIPVAAFAAPSTAPQPNTTVRLDNLADRFMHRLAYRNFGDHESLVVNHTVDAGSGRGGVRWYEFRNPNGVIPTVFQQSTYAPADGVFRWMGSIAMDGQGDMGLGFSASSSTLFPSIRYTGRLAADPPSMMTQGEGSIVEGGGSQTETIAGRWGDYSSMSVDVDDCTFWYTQEYYSVTGLRNWKTRIGSFKFPNCTAPPPGTATPTRTGTPPTALPTNTITVTPTPTVPLCPGGVDTTAAITNSDPTQTGRLARTSAVSSCTVPKTCPGVGDQLVRHYDAYTFTNNSGTSQCVTVNVSNSCGNNALLSAAYLGSFDPTNVCNNYLADMGLAGPNFSYSFSVPAGANYVVTVLENSPDVGCASYHIRISPCAVGTPQPTVTGTPPTGTPTRTGTATHTATASSTTTGTATATACASQTPLIEGFESGTLGVFTSTTTIGSSPWRVVTDTVASGTYAAHVDDPNEQADQQLTQVNPVTIPGGATVAYLQFANKYSFENMTDSYDGGVLEYSTNGVVWNDTAGLFTDNGYTGVITVTGGNILSGRQAFVGQSPGYPAFRQTRVNLMSLAGQSVQFRFRMGSDMNTGAPGWWVDDVLIYIGLPCTTGTTTPAAGTATGTATRPPATTTLPPLTVTATSVAGTATRTTVVGTSTVTATGTRPTGTPTLVVTVGATGTSTSVGTVQSTGTARTTSTTVPSTFTPSTSTSTPATPQATSTICPIQFEDVVPGSTFYPFVRCLACRGIVGGYPCGGAGEPCNANNDPYYRPGINVSRGQIAKIVSNSAGFGEEPGAQVYEDVAQGSPFYSYINRLTHRDVMSGYACGGTNPESGQAEPCGSGNRPYFRPGNSATRGQVSKIVSNAAGYNEDPGSTPTYEDVQTTNPFYNYIQRLTDRGVMSGYPCGGTNPESGQAEPCGSGNRPYFRYGNHITRGQTAKIVSNTFFPDCQSPLNR